jgi:hypothetical protein
MELAAEDGQHIHAGQRFLLEQDGNVFAAYLDTLGFFDGEGGRLVGRLIEQGGEAEELAVSRLVDDDLLVVFVDSGDLHVAAHKDMGVFAGLARFVDALPGSELSEIDLRTQDSELVFIE